MSMEPPPGFIRAYHLLTFEHAISSISLRRLKVARLYEVNDLFELFALDCMDRRTRRALRAFKDGLARTQGMLCFSRDWRNPVLWSHYAAGGRGVCLGFDIKQTLGLGGIRDVKYQKSKHVIPKSSANPSTIPAAVQDKLLVTKFQHWEYEAECRVFVKLSDAAKDQGLYFYDFSEALCLREVIIGPLCSDVVLPPLRALVRAIHPCAVVSKARPGFKFFEVKPDGRFPVE